MPLTQPSPRRRARSPPDIIVNPIDGETERRPERSFHTAHAPSVQEVLADDGAVLGEDEPVAAGVLVAAGGGGADGRVAGDAVDPAGGVVSWILLRGGFQRFLCDLSDVSIVDAIIV